jgi:hypothetical protein
MERSSETDETRSARAVAFSAAGSEHLGFLGIAPSESPPPIHSETKTKRPTGVIKQSSVLQLLEWQQYRCAMTGRELTPETASLDHIVPVRSGGEHRIENAQVLHRDVNKAKTTMTRDEFIQLCREVVQYADFSLTEDAS